MHVRKRGFNSTWINCRNCAVPPRPCSTSKNTFATLWRAQQVVAANDATTHAKWCSQPPFPLAFSLCLVERFILCFCGRSLFPLWLSVLCNSSSSLSPTEGPLFDEAGGSAKPVIKSKASCKQGQRKNLLHFQMCARIRN